MPNKFGFICISEMQRTFKVCFKGTVNWPKNKEKQKKLRFFINFLQKILVVQEKVVPLHPQNRTREFSSKNILGYGVMVTLQILVLPFLVRVRVPQLKKIAKLNA